MSSSVSHYVAGTFRVVLLATLVLTALLVTTLGIAFLIAQIRGADFGSPDQLAVGLTCSLIASLFVAVFHLRKETLAFTVRGGEHFIPDAQAVLQELGYEVVNQTSTTLATKPGFQTYLFGQGIQIRVEGEEARITGPKMGVELVRNRLRVHNQFHHVQQSVRLPRRASETQVRRVEMRLRPEQLETVRDHVMNVLKAGEGIAFDLVLTAQGNKGIPETVVEAQLRPWLEEHGIGLAIQKEMVRQQAPVILEEPIEELIA
jgi:hypothetical protein